MVIYKLLSRLLDYPGRELFENFEELERVAANDPSLNESERETICGFVSWLSLHTLTGAQQNYVETFDMTPEHDLHLTHHIFGDSGERGPALIDLTQHYSANGLAIVEKEIPDYLPLILEYLSTLDETQARFFLADARKVVSVLAKNLEKSDSPYAKLLKIVESRGQLAQAA
ncbi:nitrate reductase molybdenum cofactor assembly chaperone [Ectothiorhodospiraceae bacterium BW-2]|nr:nitrate reductase molybdenum cofactor assembly chaperone [Ectothiorhodospiraceae bacterium BW-2]